MSPTTMQKGICAFFFGQKGLMAGIGLQRTKITQYNSIRVVSSLTDEGEGIGSRAPSYFLTFFPLMGLASMNSLTAFTTTSLKVASTFSAIA